MRPHPLNHRCLAFSALFLSGTLALGGGYLARLGPVPIRFESPKLSFAEEYKLPPMDPPVPAEKPPEPPKAKPAKETAKASVNPSLTPPPVAKPSVIPPPPEPEADQADDPSAMDTPNPGLDPGSLGAPGGGGTGIQDSLKFFKRNPKVRIGGSIDPKALNTPEPQKSSTVKFLKE